MLSTTPNEFLLLTRRPCNQRSTSSSTPGARPSPRRSHRLQSLEEESTTGSVDEDASPVNEHNRGALSFVAAINAAVTTDVSAFAARDKSARTAPSVVAAGNKDKNIL